MFKYVFIQHSSGLVALCGAVQWVNTEMPQSEQDERRVQTHRRRVEKEEAEKRKARGGGEEEGDETGGVPIQGVLCYLL
jgi:hypothetical protein